MNTAVMQKKNVNENTCPQYSVTSQRPPVVTTRGWGPSRGVYAAVSRV